MYIEQTSWWTTISKNFITEISVSSITSPHNLQVHSTWAALICYQDGGKTFPLFTKITSSSSVSADKHLLLSYSDPKSWPECVKNWKTQPSGLVTASMQNVKSFYFCSYRPGNTVDGKTAAPIFYTWYKKAVRSYMVQDQLSPAAWMFKTHKVQWVLCLGKTCILPNFKIVSTISGLILLCTNDLSHPSGNTKLLFVSSNWLNVCPQTSVLWVCCIHNIKHGRLWNYSQQTKYCKTIFGAK